MSRAWTWFGRNTLAAGNDEVDDDQRHSTLLLGLLLGRLLKVALFLDVSLKSFRTLNLLLGCCLALPLIDILSHILSWLR